MLRNKECLQLDLSPADGRYNEPTSTWFDTEPSVVYEDPLEILLAIEEEEWEAGL